MMEKSPKSCTNANFYIFLQLARKMRLKKKSYYCIHSTRDIYFWKVVFSIKVWYNLHEKSFKSKYLKNDIGLAI